MKLKLKLALTALALGALAAGSMAFSVQFMGTGPGRTVKVTLAGNPSIQNRAFFAGVLNFTVFGSPVEAFCADITRTLSTTAPSNVFNVDVYSTNSPVLIDSDAVPSAGQVPVASGTAAGVQLAGRYVAALWSTAVTAPGTAAQLNDRAAALQLVVWSAVYGSAFSVNSFGNANVQSLFNSYWATPLTNVGSEYWLPNPLGNVQAQITFNPNGGEGDPVPEPFTMGLVGAAALAALKRRRAKKA
ncbi:MAG: PEP-CTERM sorting domain-containing protein [Fimbriimonadaceae bacterium]